MFHRFQHKIHQFIRSTYDHEIKRSKQTVIYKLGEFDYFYPNDAKLAAATADEKIFIVDFFACLKKSEHEKQLVRTAENCGSHMKLIAEALTGHPVPADQIDEVKAAANIIGKALKAAYANATAGKPGIVSPENEKPARDEDDDFVAALNEFVSKKD